MPAFALFALPLVLALFHLVGPVPEDLGVNGGHLSACPGPAHCARVEWAVTDSSAALESLTTLIESTPQAEVISREDAYLHATFSSRIFGFVDDLELNASTPERIEARSISRLGDSDLGVNAQRLQTLAQALQNQGFNQP
ncbi:DUF1499 domain-containing protein [Synechococcus sp. A10-1-5-9]|uniref:DUF1499 domain-containing protein n=1 Tax=Synechococcus sp. A10-1-5-9 TaxID=3392295 RepID=UPI0039EA17C4